MSRGSGALFIAVFLACAVEAVEATTIVLAAGTARDWRSAASGLAAALAVLAIVVAVLGPAVSDVPLRGLRLVVGALLLIFGLQWLRKAILRASGHKALHDEDKIFAEQLAAAAAQRRRRVGLVPDWYGFTLSFKGVLLEGLEVVFIVLTFGSNQHDVGLAAIAAGCAVLVVAAAGRGGQGAAVPGAGEHHEVRGRDHAHRVRRVLGRRGRRARTGRARTPRCWCSSRPSPRSRSSWWR